MRYLFLLLVTYPLFAKTEAEFVREHCTGKMEFMLEDRTRVDCLTSSEAQEYDFGHKSYEAIGQALWYASNTGRRAAIVLINVTSRDAIGTRRAIKIVAHYGLPVTIYVISYNKMYTEAAYKVRAGI